MKFSTILLFAISTALTSGEEGVTLRGTERKRALEANPLNNKGKTYVTPENVKSSPGVVKGTILKIFPKRKNLFQ